MKKKNKVSEKDVLVNGVIEWADKHGLNTDTPQNFKEAREAYRRAINEQKDVKLTNRERQLLRQLKASQGCLERIAEELNYGNGQPVTHVEARKLADIYIDATKELSANETLIMEIEGK